MSSAVEQELRHMPYIGITGFTKPHEAETLLETFGVPESRMLMVGVLVSSKTLAGEPARRPGRYPLVSRIAGIFPDHPRALNVIHYATKEPETLDGQVLQLVSIGGQNLGGLQFNMTWPEVAMIRRIHERLPALRLILQIGARAVEAVEHSPLRLARRVGDYRETITDALIDPSGGQGKGLHPEVVHQFLHGIDALHQPIGVGVAGGLGGADFSQLNALLRDFPYLSIDAEGKLRRESDDQLDVEAARSYLVGAKKFFRC